MDKDQRPGEARMILEHPLFVEAFQSVEKDAIEAAVDVSEEITDEVRFKRALKVNVIRDVKSALEIIMLEKPSRALRDR